jgi:DNA anti-recombination protein RmuC
MESEDAYRKKAKARLDEIGAKIDQLKAKAEQADADARIKVGQEIDQLKQRKQEMQTRLDKLKESGEAAFDEMKAGAVSKFQ